MKPRKAPARKKSGGGTLIGIFIGLILGVVAALGVAWYINKAPMPFFNKTQNGAPLPPESVARAGAQPADKAGAQQPAPPAALPGKPGDPVPDKPRFDFYKILPGNADAVPAPEAKPDAKEGKDGKDGAKEGAAAKDPLFLQAGSFQKPGDADNQKASLAMLGVEATVQQVMVGDKVWYRVRLGPYTKIDEVNKVRAELAKAGVEATVVKTKD